MKNDVCPARSSLIVTTTFEAVHVLLQGAGAGQLRPMEETVLLPLQDERQRWHGRAGPVRVPRVCPEGTAGGAGFAQKVEVRSGRAPIPLTEPPRSRFSLVGLMDIRWHA